jgi:hypothetical protein
MKIELTFEIFCKTVHTFLRKVNTENCTSLGFIFVKIFNSKKEVSSGLSVLGIADLHKSSQ